MFSSTMGDDNDDVGGGGAGNNDFNDDDSGGDYGGPTDCVCICAMVVVALTSMTRLGRYSRMLFTKSST